MCFSAQQQNEEFLKVMDQFKHLKRTETRRAVLDVQALQRAVKQASDNHRESAGGPNAVERKQKLQNNAIFRRGKLFAGTERTMLYVRKFSDVLCIGCGGATCVAVIYFALSPHGNFHFRSRTLLNPISSHAAVEFA